jgi:hypothetical protein
MILSDQVCISKQVLDELQESEARFRAMFDNAVKDISSLTIRGAADVEMGILSTSVLDVSMSGAGQFSLDQLEADSLNILISGVSNVEVSGAAAHVKIDIPDAGSVNFDDLKIKTVNATISGLGSATLWVTDQLTGNISGGGNFSHYTDPQTTLKTGCLGQFKSLGSE